MHNKLTTYYKVLAGQEIIETQTYYTQPEKDWEFDDRQKLTYDNPVYKDQCKLRGITIDDSGFVEADPEPGKVKTEEEKDSKDEELDEDDFNDDDDDSGDGSPVFKFGGRTIQPKKNKLSKPEEISMDDELNDFDEEEEEDEFDMPDSVNKSSTEKSEPQQPKFDNIDDMFAYIDKQTAENDAKANQIDSSDDIEDDFDDISDSVSSMVESSNSILETPPSNLSSEETYANTISKSTTRDNLDKGLSNVHGMEKPKIKLNIDKTALASKKIKLNIKKKDE